MDEQETLEPKLTEIFNQTRMNKCTEVWQGLLNNWITTKVFDCRIVADEPLNGKTLEELGKTYLSVGVGTDLTRLPLLDSLIVFDMLKQYNVNLQANKTQLKNFKIKTEYTQSEVFALLDEIHQSGIPVEVRSSE